MLAITTTELLQLASHVRSHVVHAQMRLPLHVSHVIRLNLELYRSINAHVTTIISILELPVVSRVIILVGPVRPLQIRDV